MTGFEGLSTPQKAPQIQSRSRVEMLWVPLVVPDPRNRSGTPAGCLRARGDGVRVAQSGSTFSRFGRSHLLHYRQHSLKWKWYVANTSYWYGTTNLPTTPKLFPARKTQAGCQLLARTCSQLFPGTLAPSSLDFSSESQI